MIDTTLKLPQKIPPRHTTCQQCACACALRATRMELCATVCVHHCMYFCTMFIYNFVPWRLFVCTTRCLYPLCVAVLLFLLLCPCFPLLLFVKGVLLSVRASPAAWLCTCCCAICASSWCLAGIILFPVQSHAVYVCCLHLPTVLFKAQCCFSTV